MYDVTCGKSKSIKVAQRVVDFSYCTKFLVLGCLRPRAELLAVLFIRFPTSRGCRGLGLVLCRVDSWLDWGCSRSWKGPRGCRPAWHDLRTMIMQNYDLLLHKSLFVAKTFLLWYHVTHNQWPHLCGAPGKDYSYRRFCKATTVLGTS